MISLEEELDDWDERDDDERQRLRELLRELGLYVDIDGEPDVVE